MIPVDKNRVADAQQTISAKIGDMGGSGVNPGMLKLTLTYGGAPHEFTTADSGLKWYPAEGVVSFVPAEATVPVTFPQGTVACKLEVSDRAGNAADALEWLFVVDTTGPSFPSVEYFLDAEFTQPAHRFSGADYAKAGPLYLRITSAEPLNEPPTVDIRRADGNSVFGLPSVAVGKAVAMSAANVSNGGGTVTDISAEVASRWGNAFDFWVGGGGAVADSFYIGADEKFTALNVIIAQAAAFSETPTPATVWKWQYHTGAGGQWNDMTAFLADNTNGRTIWLEESGALRWNLTDVESWTKSTVGGVEKYWVRMWWIAPDLVTTKPQGWQITSTGAADAETTVFQAVYTVPADGYVGEAAVYLWGRDYGTLNAPADPIAPDTGATFQIDTVAPTVTAAFTVNGNPIDPQHISKTLAALRITATFSEAIDNTDGFPTAKLSLRRADGTYIVSDAVMTKTNDTVWYADVALTNEPDSAITVVIHDGFDHAGNENASVTTGGQAHIDATPPIFSGIVVEPAVASTVAGYDTVQISFRSTEPIDMATLTVTVGGAAATLSGSSHGNTRFAFEYAVAGMEAEGQKVIAIHGHDLAGNEGAASASVILDFTAPTITITKPPAGVLEGEEFELEWTWADANGVAVGQAQVTLNGEDITGRCVLTPWGGSYK